MEINGIVIDKSSSSGILGTVVAIMVVPVVASRGIL